MVGQGRALERQAMEPLARHVDGGPMRGMQSCMSAAMWEEDPMRETSHGLVADEMGDPQGVLLVEEAGVVKKGRASVGVARPSCGTLGKVAKRQGGGAPPRPRGRALHWWTNDFVSPHRGGAPPTPSDGTRARCPTRRPCPPSPRWPPRGCVPSGATAASPCTSLVADWLSGKRPACRDAVDAWVGGTALVAVPAEPRWWRQRPLPPETPSTDKGAVRAKGVCPPEPPTPRTVAAWAPRRASSGWYRRMVSEGTKGPSAEAWARTRGTLGTDGLPNRTGWLGRQRPLGSSPT